ncbi:MAG TPA: AAA family ATPase [Candidatus Defluviicoccus seviourii]|nr:AAA family ATPase [Candidatus Defluviicoccus seviourii]
MIFQAEFCRDLGEMGVIVGAPGTGKTATCRHLRDTRGFRMLTLAPNNCRLRSALTHILEALTGYVPSEYATRNRGYFIDSFVRELVEWDRKTVLMVDEAQHANAELLEYLRSLSDSSVGDDRLPHLGILLLGNETVLNRMYEDGPNRRNVRPEFAHIVSRFGLRPLEFEAAEDGDVIAICVHWGVTDPADQGFLIDISRGGGGLRAVGKVLSMAFDMAEGGKIDTAALRHAAAFRGVTPRGES